MEATLTGEQRDALERVLNVADDYVGIVHYESALFDANFGNFGKRLAATKAYGELRENDIATVRRILRGDPS